MKNIFISALILFAINLNCFAKKIDPQTTSNTSSTNGDVEIIYINTANGIIDGGLKSTPAYRRPSDGQIVPTIVSGGLLPGPKAAITGEDYFLQNFLPGLTNKLLILLMAASVVMFIVGGIMYLTAQGDTDITKKAFDTIFWSVLGLVIAILSFAAVKFFVGINFTP